MSVTAVPIRPIRKRSVAKLWIGLAVLTLAAIALAWTGTSAQQRETTASGLQYQVIEEGEGAAITPEDVLMIHFTGRREDGTVFGSTVGGEPITTPPDTFIPGFSEGLLLMRKGAKYRLWIPPNLGYQGNVPPTAPFRPDETLVFEIEVVDVARGMAGMWRMQQMMGAQGAPPQGAPGSEDAQPEAPAEEGSGRGRGRGGR